MVGWTLDELSQRVAQALAAVGVTAPNGRVSRIPDARVIRWYATVGLLDRPVARRGRAAIYGPRHLLQLVSIKRRQAQGHTLAQIQAELTGATDDTLRRVADLPAALITSHTAGAAGPESEASPAASHPGVGRDRFWAAPVAAAGPRHASDGGLAALHAVSVGAGQMLLLLPVAPNRDDLAAILAAAQPLLDLLAARGLTSERTATADTREHHRSDRWHRPSQRHDHRTGQEHPAEGAQP